MRKVYFSATVYAKQQPEPLIGDEIYPDGGVGITFVATPNLSFTELGRLIADLTELQRSMAR